jgi:hypothetical protein
VNLDKLLKLALEQTWRLGLLLLLGGLTFLIADRIQLPAPGALTVWIGWASLAALVGVALVAASLVNFVLEFTFGVIQGALVAHRARRRELQALRESGEEAVQTYRRLMRSNSGRSGRRFKDHRALTFGRSETRK